MALCGGEVEKQVLRQECGIFVESRSAGQAYNGDAFQFKKGTPPQRNREQMTFVMNR